MVLCCAPGRLLQQLELYVGAWLRPLMKPARCRCSCCPAPVNRSIRSCACCGWAAATVMPAVYMVASSQPGGSEPDKVTPLVLMISVDCVHPIGRRASDAASSRIAVAPFGKILRRAGNLVGDAELIKDICNVNSGRRGFGIRHEDRVGRQQNLAQISGILDGGLGIAGADGEGGFDQADIGNRRGNDQLLLRQFGEERRGQDDDVCRRALAQFVGHDPDRAKLACDIESGLALERRCQGFRPAPVPHRRSGCSGCS